MLAYCGLRVCADGVSDRSPADSLLQITHHLVELPSGTNT